MSSIWSNRWQGINQLELSYRNADVHIGTASDKWWSADILRGTGDCWLVQGKIIDCLWEIIGCLVHMIDTENGYDPPQAITNYLYYWTWHYVETEDYELTAAKILTAWIDANADVRLMTVLTLDELRRESWDKQFTSYRIAAAPQT